MLYPVKAEKKARTQEFMNVFFCVFEDKIAVHKRNSKGLLSNLWELPNESRAVAIPAALQEFGILQAEIIPMKQQKHVFTHIEWYMDCYFIRVKENIASDLIWITEEEAEAAYALPSAFRKIWSEGIRMMKDQ